MCVIQPSDDNTVYFRIFKEEKMIYDCNMSPNFKGQLKGHCIERIKHKECFQFGQHASHLLQRSKFEFH